MRTRYDIVKLWTVRFTISRTESGEYLGYLEYPHHEAITNTYDTELAAIDEAYEAVYRDATALCRNIEGEKWWKDKRFPWS